MTVASGHNLGVLWEGGEGREAEAGKETEEGRKDGVEVPGEEVVGVDEVVVIIGIVETGRLLEAGLGRDTSWGEGSTPGGEVSNLTALSS